MTDKEKIREDVSKLIIPESECNGMSLMEKGRQYAYREVLGIIDSTSEEPVSDDLEEAADNCYYHNHAYTKESFIEGAQWQKTNLWKSADGNDLPKYEREVIALEGIVDPTATDCLCGYKVIFAHRPNPNGWDGKSITTGEVEHYTPKTYGEGGWNIPNIVYWLDVELPKEIEL